MELTSELALRAYQQVFWGLDKPLGYTLDQAVGGPVSIPDGIPWYVRHPDARMPGWYLRTLVGEIAEKGIKGLSLAGCRALADDDWSLLREVPQLEVLDLFNSGFGDVHLPVLSSLVNLRSLNLAGTSVSDRALDALVRLPRLQTLHIGFTSLGDAGLSRLAGLGSLAQLDVRSSRVTDRGLLSLCRLPALRDLGLEETAVGDAGVAELVPLSERLERLYLGYTKITEGSLSALSRFTRLRTLMLRATAIGPEHDAALLRALPALGGPGTGPGGVSEGLIR